MRYQRGVRLEALQDAMRVQNAQVGPANNEYMLFYPTQSDKEKAVQKAWSDLAAKYNGSEVGVMAEYYLASEAADKGNNQEAEKRFKEVADSGETDYASLAKDLAGSDLCGSGQASGSTQPDPIGYRSSHGNGVQGRSHHRPGSRSRPKRSGSRS